MDLYHRRRSSALHPTLYLALSASLTLIGCASPAPPRAPSLQLPQPVRDLTANRIGNTVELHFTVPSNSTDKLALRGSAVSGQLCRQLPQQPCLPVSPRTPIQINNSIDSHNLATWTDVLPPTLTQGPPQLLTYRVEFLSPTNHSAGPSNQAFTASGPAPAPVEDLQPSGSRLGIILQWSPAPGQVLLRREDTAAPETANSTPAGKRHASIIWLQTNDSKGENVATNKTLDTSALPEIPYQYSAQRRSTVQLPGHTIELRSAMSLPVRTTLSTTYPPPAPTGLTVAAYSTGTPPRFGVDLVWQPVNETGLITHLAGYNIYRQPLDSTSQPTGPRTQLNTSPVLQPAFHDSTATPTTAYQYSVDTVDVKGNQSASTTVSLLPESTP